MNRIRMWLIAALGIALCGTTTLANAQSVTFLNTSGQRITSWSKGQTVLVRITGGVVRRPYMVYWNRNDSRIDGVIHRVDLSPGQTVTLAVNTSGVLPWIVGISAGYPTPSFPYYPLGTLWRNR